MTPPAEPIDDSIVKQPSSRIVRALTRMDEAVVATARAVWRVISEGSAAYGMAEYAYFMDPHFREDAAHDTEADQIADYPHNLRVRGDTGFSGEF
ncbi:MULTISPECIES: hypothetical protein [unclassified Acidisoma]|jgi:hypothetical protein|uniref:hypothetical protein n=1 Tax=unclassified Acidisoma TaxID=2634065 RepID=UPI00131C4A1B|nr:MULTISPECIES: hypothetical protein [unclassified Acidisoma]